MSPAMRAYRRDRRTSSSANDSDDEESDHQPHGVVRRREFLLENGTRLAERPPSRSGAFSPIRKNSTSRRSNSPRTGVYCGDAPSLQGSFLRRPASPQRIRPASRGRTSPSKSPPSRREVAPSRKSSYRGEHSKGRTPTPRGDTSPVRVQSPRWDFSPKGGFFPSLSPRMQCGLELNDDDLPILIRNMSLRVKQQIQTTLSDPLKRRAAGSLKKARDRAAIPAASVRQKVHEISNRLTMPRFFTDERSSSDIDGNANDEASSSEESDDPEFLELQERSAIVEKYEKGAEQEVEEWENPDFELYKATDRYGFVHKNGEVLSQSESEEKRRIAKEASRERKWLRMMAAWRAGKTVEKLRDRVWKGVPEKLRAVVWAYLLDVERYKRESPTNVYRELLMRARLVSRDIKQIDLDINRTYRDHLAFRRRYDLKQQSLFNVLAAYAMYNTEVGYCQGMSQIAALFLMYMDEEDAFWCLHALLVNKKHAMHGFFVPGFPKLARFQAHYEKVLHKYLPRLKKHLDKAGIPPIYLTKWWFGCFLDRVPFPLALRLWDVFLLEGDVILIAMAYNIMKMHQKAIKKLQIENFMEYIQTTIAQNFGFPDEETMYSLRDCLRKLQSDRMTLPPPPGASDPPELPMKPLGPVLSRSMVDIRMDIAEIQSRCSRANSLAGKSPGVNRRHRTPPSPTPIRQKFVASSSKQKEHPNAIATATQRDFEAQRDLSALTATNSPSSHSSSSTVRENAAARVVARHGDVSPTSAMTPLAVSAARPPVTSRPFDRQCVHSPPPSANALAPSHSMRLPTSVQQLHDMSDVGRTREGSTALNPSKAASPPLVVEKMRVESPEAVSSYSHVPSPPPSSQSIETASRRSSRQHATSSLQREAMRAHLPSESRDLPFLASPSPKVAEQTPPPEPPIDYNNSVHHSITSSGGSPPIPSPPVDPYPPRNMLETSATYRPERAYGGGCGNCTERRKQPALPGNEQSALRTYSQKTVSDVSEKSSSGSRIVQRDSFYDNVPPPTPALRCDADEAAAAYDKRRAGGPRRALGELIFESRCEDRSVERRFRNQQNSPTLFESRRQQTVTEVETRVIQLPNNVTYVSVGDDDCDNIRRTPVQHFHSGYGSPRRFEPSPPGFRGESYSPYDEPRRFRQGMEEVPMKPQTGSFLSHFRDESVGGAARGGALQNTSSTAYYALDGRRYAPALERRPTPPSRSHHFPFPTETRGKHSMV